MMEAGAGMTTEAALPVKTGGAAFCVFVGGWQTVGRDKAAPAATLSAVIANKRRNGK